MEKGIVLDIGNICNEVFGLFCANHNDFFTGSVREKIFSYLQGNYPRNYEKIWKTMKQLRPPPPFSSDNGRRKKEIILPTAYPTDFEQNSR